MRYVLFSLLIACTQQRSTLRIDTTSMRAALSVGVGDALDAPQVAIVCASGEIVEATFDASSNAFEISAPACGLATIGLTAKRAARTGESASVMAYAGAVQVTLVPGVTDVAITVRPYGEVVFSSSTPCTVTIDQLQTDLDVSQPLQIGPYKASCGARTRDFSVAFAERISVSFDAQPAPSGMRVASLRAPDVVFASSRVVFDAATVLAVDQTLLKSLKWTAGGQSQPACDDALVCAVTVPSGVTTFAVAMTGTDVRADKTVQVVGAPVNLPFIRADGVAGGLNVQHAGGATVMIVANGAASGGESLISTGPTPLVPIDEAAATGICTLTLDAPSCTALPSFVLTNAEPAGYPVACTGATLSNVDANLRVLRVLFQNMDSPCSNLELSGLGQVDVVVDLGNSNPLSFGDGNGLVVHTQGHILLRGAGANLTIAGSLAGVDAPDLPTVGAHARPVVQLQAGAGHQVQLEGQVVLEPQAIAGSTRGRFAFLVGAPDAPADALHDVVFSMGLEMSGFSIGHTPPADLVLLGRRVFLPGLAAVQVNGADGGFSVATGSGGSISLLAQGANAPSGRESIQISSLLSSPVSFSAEGGDDAGGGAAGAGGVVHLQTGAPSGPGGEGQIAFAGDVFASGGPSTGSAGSAGLAGTAASLSVEQLCSGHCTAAIAGDVVARGGSGLMHALPQSGTQAGNGGDISVIQLGSPLPSAPAHLVTVLQPHTMLDLQGGACVDVVGGPGDAAVSGSGGRLRIEQVFPSVAEAHAARESVAYVSGNVNVSGGACASSGPAGSNLQSGSAGVLDVYQQAHDRSSLIARRLQWLAHGGDVSAQFETVAIHNAIAGNGGSVAYETSLPGGFIMEASQFNIDGGVSAASGAANIISGGAGGSWKMFFNAPGAADVSVDSLSSLSQVGGDATLLFGTADYVGSGLGGMFQVVLPTGQTATWPAVFSLCFGTGAEGGLASAPTGATGANVQQAGPGDCFSSAVLPM